MLDKTIDETSLYELKVSKPATTMDLHDYLEINIFTYVLSYTLIANLYPVTCHGVWMCFLFRCPLTFL
jgi:hypothetical protein